MCQAYNKDDAEGVFLVYTTNAFNWLNHYVTLHSISPSIVTVFINTNLLRSTLVNTYWGNAELFVECEKRFCVKVLPREFHWPYPFMHLQQSHSSGPVSEVWLRLMQQDVGVWKHCGCNKLNTHDPKFDYDPNGRKTWLITRESTKHTATNIFADINLQVTIQNRRHLGAPLCFKLFVKSDDRWSEGMGGWAEQPLQHHSYPSTCSTSPLGYIHGLEGKWLIRETFRRWSAITNDNAHLDFRPKGFWSNGERNTSLMLTFSVQMLHQTRRPLSPPTTDDIKGQRETSTWSGKSLVYPLVFNTLEGASSIFFKSSLSTGRKKGEWLQHRPGMAKRGRLKSLLHAAVTFIRGSCWIRMLWQHPVPSRQWVLSVIPVTTSIVL